MSNFIVIIAVFLVTSLPSMAAETTTKDLELSVSQELKQHLEEYIEQQIVLPDSLESLDALQNYAAHYSQAAYDQFSVQTQTTKKAVVYHTNKNPCLRLASDKKFRKGETSFERIKIISQKAPKMQFSNRNTPNNIEIFVHLEPYNQEQANLISRKFARFLLVNNPDVLPNYQTVFANLHKHIIMLQKDFANINEYFKKFSVQDIANIMRIPHFDATDKTQLRDKITSFEEDVKRYKNSIEFIINNPSTVQILDLYYIAEQSFEIISYMENVAKQIVESGSFDTYRKGVNNIEGSSKTTTKIKTPVKKIEQFFRHRQFPCRSFYLFSRAVAFSLKDFANALRANAGLSNIPEEIFEQGELKDIFNIDESLLTFEEYELKTKKKYDNNYISAANQKFLTKNDDAKKQAKKQAKKRAKKLNNKSDLKKYQAEQEKIYTPKILGVINQQPAPPCVVESAPDTKLVPEKNDIGARVFRLLSCDEKAQITQLFLLQEALMTRENIKVITLSVYKALIDLNEVKIAAQFLRKASDTRLFQTIDTGKYLSKSDLRNRLLSFLVLNIIHPDFEKETILKTDKILQEQVAMQKIVLGKEEFGRGDFDNLKKLLIESEEAIDHAPLYERRTLLINLADAWHKLAVQLEQSQKPSQTQKNQIKEIHEKIISLLSKSRPFMENKGAKPASLIEAYLYNYYLKTDFFTPSHEALSDDIFNRIQRDAFNNLENVYPLPCKSFKTIDIHGKELARTQICNSIFHAVTNSELDEYLIIKFKKHIKEKKIPLFIRHNGIVYRTDVFGGSKLKAKVSEGDYGNLIAVSLRAGEFFKRWFTTEESFWYGQRAFLAQTPGDSSKALQGKLVIATIPDEEKFVIKGSFMVQDGLGYIKASRARGLKLSPLDRREIPAKKNVAYQALHAYDCNKANRRAALELLNSMKNRSFNASDYPTMKDYVNACMCTVPKLTAIGIPVQGHKVLLPRRPEWHGLAHKGLMLGRNPYSAKSLQFVSFDDISGEALLDNLEVFQYSLTGLYETNKTDQLSGAFFKGLLAVIDDKDWPKKYDKADLIVSSKDQKLDQQWVKLEAKKADQAREQIIGLNGILTVTQEMNKKQLAGVPKPIADKLAGDYDGDEYDFLTSDSFEALATLVKTESEKAILNPKIDKSFTLRETAGNYTRILAILKPLLQTWVSIVNRFYNLSKADRVTFADAMAPTNLLKQWADKEFSDTSYSNLEVITMEMQLGIKFGEDIFKTSVNADQVLERAREYERALLHLKNTPMIPYGNGYKKKLESGFDLKAATSAALEAPESSNLVAKSFRAFTRFLGDDAQYKDYMSDDESADEN